MAYNWYVNLPGDSDIVSQHPANERSFRATVHNAFGTEHDTEFGRHRIPAGTTADRSALNGSWANGSIFVNTDDARFALQMAQGVVAGQPASWVNVSTEFPTNTQMIFCMATAPVGWVQRDDLNDRLLRVVTGPGTDVGGDWTISGMSVESANHTHTVNTVSGIEGQNHTHSFSATTGVPSISVVLASTTGVPTAGAEDHVHTVSGTTGTESAGHSHNVNTETGTESVGHNHTFNGIWRPAYVNVIVAYKS